MNMTVEFCGIKMKSQSLPHQVLWLWHRIQGLYGPESGRGYFCKRTWSYSWTGNKGSALRKPHPVFLNCIGLENPGVEKFLSYYFTEAEVV